MINRVRVFFQLSIKILADISKVSTPILEVSESFNFVAGRHASYAFAILSLHYSRFKKSSL